MEFQLAQLNIGKAKDLMESEVMEEFSDGLDPINAIAENASGFVWRLKDDSGNATDMQYFDDPLMLVNMSVWEDIESLKPFMFKTHHLHFLKHRKNWFESDSEATYVLWWVSAGHLPTVEEAMSRLRTLREMGDTLEAFSFAKPFSAPDCNG